jgi:hypothetical protein
MEGQLEGQGIEMIHFVVGMIGLVRPKFVYDLLTSSKIYLSADQMRTIRAQCHQNYQNWPAYEHALCSRVIDRWNLREYCGVEGYYYRSVENESNDFTPSIVICMHSDW